MTTKLHTKTVDELRAELALTTNPVEYDRLQDDIREAEKAGHLHAAALEIDRRQREAAAHQAKIEAHNEHRQTLAVRPAAMLNLDRNLFKMVQQVNALIAERYNLTQDTRALYRTVIGEAQELGLPAPERPVDPNDWPSMDSPQAYGADWFRRFEENQRQAERAGVELTLEHMGKPSFYVGSK